MNRASRMIVSLGDIESDADFILYSDTDGVISEHCTQGEARMAFFEEAGKHGLGDYLPRIYRRQDQERWVPLSWQ